MKKLIILLALAHGLSAFAADQGYLSGTNTIALVDGESLIVLSAFGDTSARIIVEFPPYDAPEPNTHTLILYHNADMAARTILGPCKLKNQNDTGREFFAYKINRAPVFTNPVNVIMIPIDYDGDVDLMVETSADMETWTPIYSGSAGTSNSATFFRTRLITK